MTPAELQTTLISLLPTAVPGIEAAEPWSARPYGLTVTAKGAGTARRGEKLAEHRYYKPDETV